jgi:hypothetical protein
MDFPKIDSDSRGANIPHLHVYDFVPIFILAAAPDNEFYPRGSKPNPCNENQQGCR